MFRLASITYFTPPRPTQTDAEVRGRTEASSPMSAMPAERMSTEAVTAETMTTERAPAVKTRAASKSKSERYRGAVPAAIIGIISVWSIVRVRA
jgi:hypothetical protein